MDAVLPDADSAFGKRIRERLENSVVAWLTTVGKDGAPQPNPVWFTWDGETILTYNRARAARVGHVRQRPRVSFNFDGDGQGGGIGVIIGDAEIVDGLSAGSDPAYLEKYRSHITRIGHDPASFAAAYPVAVRIRPTRVRGF